MTRFLAFLALLTAVPGCLSLKSDNSRVVARFDGASVTENDLRKKVGTLPKTVQSIASDHKKDLIEDMAAEHFLLKEAVRRKLDAEPDVKDLLAVARKKILIARLVEKEVDEKISVDEAEAGKYYEFHKEEFMTPLLLRASHILVKTEEEANAVKASLDSGGDFEETARQKSIDLTAIRGGDLGFFQKGQFVPEFEETVFAMSKGQTSAPVKTAFGYHLIRLNDRVEPRVRDFKAVRGLVEERLLNEKRSKIFREYVQKLKGNAKIDIDETALETVSLAPGSSA
jgi:peptidyl-prolyl cis-trans isomerase C